MQYAVVFHPAALEELAAIGEHIAAKAGPDRAALFISNIRAFCSQLATFPKRGNVRDDIMLGLRIIGYRRTVSIAFTVNDDAVLILGVFYAGRNITTDLFDQR